MKKRIDFRVGKIVNKVFYFSCYEHCGLYKYDILQQRTSFVAFFPEENIMQTNLHKKCLFFEGKLYFIPGGGGKNLHIYNCETGKVYCVPLLKKRGWDGDAFIIDRYIWMISFHIDFKYVIRINIDTLEVEILKDLFKEISEYCDEKKYLLKKIAIEGESIWFAILHSSEIIHFSLLERKIVRYQTEIKDLFGIYITAKDMWLTSYTDEHIYKWNPEIGVCDKCEVQGARIKHMPSNNIFEIEGEIIALPYLSEYITKYNDKRNCFEKTVEYPVGFCFTNPNEVKFPKFDCNQNIIFCFPFNSIEGLLVDIKKNVALTFSVTDEKRILLESYLSLGNKILGQQYVLENNDMILPDYIEIINYQQNEWDSREREVIGKKTYDFLINRE